MANLMHAGTTQVIAGLVAAGQSATEDVAAIENIGGSWGCGRYAGGWEGCIGNERVSGSFPIDDYMVGLQGGSQQ